MDTLPLKLRKNGYDYTQVLRGSKTCLYSQSIKGNLIAYEVFKIRTKPKRKVFDNWVEAKEKYPADKDFGYTAWSYSTWDKAKEKYNSLELNEPDKK
jgi:hypothetical protein